MFKWRLKRIWAADCASEPELDPDWEPFGIQPAENGCWIWLRWKPQNK